MIALPPNQMKRLRVRSNVECVDIARAELTNWPFFAALDAAVSEHLARDYPGRPGVSYAIWGGAAANMLLWLVGHCNIHFSLHDVELFFIDGGHIIPGGESLDRLASRLENDPAFLVTVGGRRIVEAMLDLTCEDFQQTRLELKDGDLVLNNVLLAMPAQGQRCQFLLPLGLLKSLLCGQPILTAKPNGDLVTLARLFRRMSRTAAKAVRFEHVANAAMERDARRELQDISARLESRMSTAFEAMSSAHADDRSWLRDRGLHDIETARHWVVVNTLSEIAKRLAGLHGVSSRDIGRFENLLFGEPGIARHPFLLSVCDISQDYFARDSALAAGALETCFNDFAAYQLPGAELLVARYLAVASGALPMLRTTQVRMP